MHKSVTSAWWKQWAKPGRVIPLLTILGAGTAIVLSLIDVIQLSIAEEVVIALLALLAADALSERLSVLERIESKLSCLSKPGGFLSDRSTQMPPLEEYLQGAKEFLVVGGSLAGLVPEYRDYFREISNGCALRFVLFDPDSPALESVAKWVGTQPEIFRKEIEIARSMLDILKAGGANIEVRMSNAIPSLTVMVVDGSQPHGKIRVSVNPYGCPPARRPFFELTRKEDERWYRLFHDRYECLWRDLGSSSQQAT